MEKIDFYKEIEQELLELKSKSQWRTLRVVDTPYNFASNDYLGLKSQTYLQEEFLQQIQSSDFIMSSSSSRLLTGNCEAMEKVETKMAQLLGVESVLVLNSGYHLNMGILPAISNEQTLILADKLVHASLIDGLRLSQGKVLRFRHNSEKHLRALLEKYHSLYKRLIIVTESIFSMDGDEADLETLVTFKKQYNALLYVDEAHAFGVRGRHGMGCVEEKGLQKEIDFIVGTFGKAGASVGAYVACKKSMRAFLINKMRPLIFSTALPPINWLWTEFMLDSIASASQARLCLEERSATLRHIIQQSSYTCPSTSHIIPIIVGDSEKAMQLAARLESEGYLALAVRPPTVAQGSARIRLSLPPNLSSAVFHQFVNTLEIVLK